MDVKRQLRTGSDSTAPKLALSKREAAAAIGVSEKTIERMVKAGRLRGSSIGSRLVFPVSELQALLDRSLTPQVCGSEPGRPSSADSNP